jgi:hypothetical protein
VSIALRPLTISIDGGTLFGSVGLSEQAAASSIERTNTPRGEDAAGEIVVQTIRVSLMELIARATVGVTPHA